MIFYFVKFNDGIKGCFVNKIEQNMGKLFRLRKP